MSDEKTNTSDDLSAETAEALQPPREKYEVVNPLFKRGRLWKKGTRIDLDADTAARFLETGDIKEIK